MLDACRLHNLIMAIKDLAIGAVKKQRGKQKRSALLIAGSLTVEAALALPLCLGVLFLLAGLLSAARVSEQMDHYLFMTSRRLAAWSEAQDGVHMADAYRCFYFEADKSGVPFDRIDGGKAGVLLTLPENGQNDGLICLRASYRIRVPGYLAGSRGIRVTDQVCTRGWIGRKSAASNESENAEYVPVYVTENGIVYHKDRGCTYLDLDVRKVSYEAAARIRNRYGERYHACEKCARGKRTGTLYVTGMGNAWHTDPHCSGLSRYLHTMDEQDALASGLRPCSRCGR